MPVRGGNRTKYLQARRHLHARKPIDVILHRLELVKLANILLLRGHVDTEHTYGIGPDTILLLACCFALHCLIAFVFFARIWNAVSRGTGSRTRYLSVERICDR
jgi:hypothetical protein